MIEIIEKIFLENFKIDISASDTVKTSETVEELENSVKTHWKEYGYIEKGTAGNGIFIARGQVSKGQPRKDVYAIEFNGSTYIYS